MAPHRRGQVPLARGWDGCAPHALRRVAFPLGPPARESELEWTARILGITVDELIKQRAADDIPW